MLISHDLAENGVFQALSENYPSTIEHFRDCLPAQIPPKSRPNLPNIRPKWRVGRSLAKTMALSQILTSQWQESPWDKILISQLQYSLLITTPHHATRVAPSPILVSPDAISTGWHHISQQGSKRTQASGADFKPFYPYPPYAKHFLITFTPISKMIKFDLSGGWFQKLEACTAISGWHQHEPRPTTIYFQ